MLEAFPSFDHNTLHTDDEAHDATDSYLSNVALA